jgi:hypothetical protein
MGDEQLAVFAKLDTGQQRACQDNMGAERAGQKAADREARAASVQERDRNDPAGVLHVHGGTDKSLGVRQRDRCEPHRCGQDWPDGPVQLHPHLRPIAGSETGGNADASCRVADTPSGIRKNGQYAGQ